MGRRVLVRLVHHALWLVEQQRVLHLRVWGVHWFLFRNDHRRSYHVLLVHLLMSVLQLRMVHLLLVLMEQRLLLKVLLLLL